MSEETTASKLSEEAEKARFQHELASLNAISWALSQSLDLDRVLELALETTLRVMGSQAGCIHLPAESDSHVLQLVAHTGFPADFAPRSEVLAWDDPQVQRIAASENVVVSGPGHSLPGFLTGDNPCVELPSPGICLCLPLLARGRFQGLLSIWLGESSPDRARLLRTIGEHVAVAIDNAQLYRRAQRDAQRLSREAGRWHALNQAAVTVGGARSEQAAYDTVTRALSSLDLSAVILAFEPRTQNLSIASIATPLPRFVRAMERLIALQATGFQVPPSRLEFYRQILERGEAELFKLETDDIAGWLPASVASLAPSIVERLGLELGIAVPLKYGEQTIALLLVSGSGLAPEDVPAITAFADQASAAIENAQLIQAERHQREVAEMLHDLVATVNSTLDVDQVLLIAVQRLQKLHRAAACSVSFLEEDGNTFVFKATTDPAIDVSQHPTFPRPGSIAGRALEERRVQVVDDVDPSVEHRADIARRTGIAPRSLLTAPLFADDDQPLGVIQVLSASPRTFTQADADLLTTTAALIETAITRAQAYARAVQLAEGERRQREMAEALHRAALALTSTMALDQVFDRILTELQHVVPYDSASVQLLREDHLEIIGGRGFPNLAELLGISFPARGNNPNALVMQSRRPVILADVQPRFPDFKRDPHLAADIHGWLGAPLIIGDRLIGMLALDKRQPDFYTEAHAQTAMAYAAQAAIAIENARLHQTLQDYAAELQTRVEVRTAEVNREHERLLAVLENAGEAIAIANAEGIIEYANPTWQKLTGYDVAQVVQGRTLILDDEAFSDLLAAVRNTGLAQRIWRRELMGRRPDGATYVVDLTVTPVFDTFRTLVNLVAIYRDVTQYKELDRIKSEFLSTAAHELRSPLTSILGFSELLLLREDLSQEERTRFLKYINEHALQLKQLVSDLLDISRIEAGASFAVKLERVDLYDLFERELQSWRETCPDRTFHLAQTPEWPPVRADRERVGQVIRNLLSNATKYSPPGSTIAIGATAVGGFMEVSVADQGIGMTSEELAHVFDKFWRADASSTAVEGTGLGLVIVKHIVEQHGGHIWVESAKGSGTIVHFTLPLVERQITVLIVDDEAGVREVEQRILANNGIATLLSQNGKQAIQIAQAHRPDLILLDLMMPGMPGKDVLQALKSNPATQHIPVVVVSGRSTWQTIEESYMLGAVDFLTKPFEYQELLSRVRRAIKLAGGSRQPVVRSHLPLTNS